ncbi:MAG: hypothetical protein IT223_03735 [Crocinitomicaceae bacterium]|nr:hypothetical protein [Crocinitomicaceae bacterium]
MNEGRLSHIHTLGQLLWANIDSGSVIAGYNSDIFHSHYIANSCAHLI